MQILFIEAEFVICLAGLGKEVITSAVNQSSTHGVENSGCWRLYVPAFCVIPQMLFFNSVQIPTMA
jgi:hypothetical protein